MKTRSEFIRVSIFIIGSTVAVAAAIAVILFLLTVAGGRTAESIQLAQVAFMFVSISSVLPIAVFTVLTKYTFLHASFEKRATIYGFCNMVTAFFLTVYLASDGKTGPVPGFNSETLIVYSLPAVICFFIWIFLAIKSLK